MRHAFAALALGVCVVHSSAVRAQNRPDQAAVQKQIEANERTIIEAIFKNDQKTFQGLVASDSVIVTGEGVMKVSVFVPMMKQTATSCKFNTVETSDHTFYWLNDTALVHIYKTTMDATCDGQPIPPAWSSSVWVNKDGKWQGAFHQETEISPPTTPKK